jgi:hypothetical protein
MLERLMVSMMFVTPSTTTMPEQITAPQTSITKRHSRTRVFFLFF